MFILALKCKMNVFLRIFHKRRRSYEEGSISHKSAISSQMFVKVSANYLKYNCSLGTLSLAQARSHLFVALVAHSEETQGTRKYSSLKSNSILSHW